MFQNEYRLLKNREVMMIALILATYSSGVFANDTAFGGDGSLPIPISQPDIVI